MQGIKCLIYGRAGVGKTMLAMTAPNCLIITAEGGLRSLKGRNLPAIEVKTVQDLTEIHDWAQRSKEAKQFKTLHIDSITEIAEIVLANAKMQCKDPRQAYGELLEKMTMVVKAYRDLKGYNVVMIAKEELRSDEMNGTSQYVPLMPGKKLGPSLPYLFDEVFNMNIGKTPDGKTFRYLRTQPTFQYEAKDRSGLLLEREEANLSSIFNKLQ
jgi:hypothetical protein